MSTRVLRCLALAAAAGLAPWAAQACSDGGIDAEAEGGRVFTAPNVGAPFGGIVPFSGGFNLSCAGGSFDGALTAPTADGGSTAVLLSAAANGANASVHSRAASAVVGGATLLSRNTTPAIFADAAAVLHFDVVGSNGAPVAGATVRFDIAGDGVYRGNGSNGGSGGFSASVRSGAAGVVSNISAYHDSLGVNLTNTTLQFQNVQNIPVAVDFSIAYTANFYGGPNWLQLDLYTYAWGDGSADFENTARIVGVTVLTPGADIVLPPGLFVADASQPGHYVLAALAPVPEPASALLLVAGIALLRWRRVAADHTGRVS